MLVGLLKTAPTIGWCTIYIYIYTYKLYIQYYISYIVYDYIIYYMAIHSLDVLHMHWFISNLFWNDQQIEAKLQRHLGLLCFGMPLGKNCAKLERRNLMAGSKVIIGCDWDSSSLDPCTPRYSKHSNPCLVPFFQMHLAWLYFSIIVGSSRISAGDIPVLRPWSPRFCCWLRYP